MTEFVIRKTENKDAVQGLNILLFGEALMLEMRKQECWLVKCGPALAGFATYQDAGDNTVFLSRAGVLPEYRGRGLQKRLIRVRTKYAKHMGYDCSITYTSQDNPESYSSLQQCGFKLYKPAYPWAGKDMLYWKKKLV